MSARELIAKWEDASAQALTPSVRLEQLDQQDLEAVGAPVKSGVRAGQGACGCIYLTLGQTGQAGGSCIYLTLGTPYQ